MYKFRYRDNIWLSSRSLMPPFRRRAQGKTAEEKAEAAAAKDREKQEKKAARERAKQEKAAQKYTPAFCQGFTKVDGSAIAYIFGQFKSTCGTAHTGRKTSARGDRKGSTCSETLVR